VHVSRYFNYTVSHPLIIAFHGAGSTAQTQEAISGMSAGNGLVIDSRDVVVVYGQSTMGTKGANGTTRLLTLFCFLLTSL
jgi:poly(3-hydroxybutyrate) depolymerase